MWSSASAFACMVRGESTAGLGGGIVHQLHHSEETEDLEDFIANTDSLGAARAAANASTAKCLDMGTATSPRRKKAEAERYQYG